MVNGTTPADPMEQLNERQRVILKMHQEGAARERMAAYLGIQPQSMSPYLSTIRKVVGEGLCPTRSRTEAAQRAANTRKRQGAKPTARAKPTAEALSPVEVLEAERDRLLQKAVGLDEAIRLLREG